MGDEVSDEGADDAPDPEPRRDAEPTARDDEPPADTDADDTIERPESTDEIDPGEEDATDSENPKNPEDAGDTGDIEDAEDADIDGDTGETETPEDAEGTDDGDDGDATGSDEPTSVGPSPVLTSFGEFSGGSGGDDGDPDDEEGDGKGEPAETTGGEDPDEPAGDEEGGSSEADSENGTEDDPEDAGEIPDDYDPFEPAVDLDYDATQYTSPADDAEADGEGEESGSTDAGGAETSAAKSDGGYAGGTDGVAVGEYEAPTDEGELFEGPPDDQEMPLADHIEEMVRRLGVVIVVMAVVSGIVFPFGDRIINFLWYSVLVSDPVPRPRVYHPLALILARLKVATLAGFIVALPVFVYESYLFMRPGLYPSERRYYLASVPTSLVLATVGVLFAYFLVLPGLFTYFLYYSDEVTIIAFGLTETFDLMVLMLGGFALIFQIPLFVMLAIMMGLTTRQWMADRRLYFWGAFLGLAFLFSPDPTGMAPIIVAATMVALFEGTLFLLKWTKRGRRQVRGG